MHSIAVYMFNIPASSWDKLLFLNRVV